MAPRAFYIPQLDGLRFLAFLMVFGFHFLPKDAPSYPVAGELFALAMRSGRYGVDLFFVLSAFLITTLLLREIERTGDLDVKAFYARRVLRIWPLFFLYLAVIALMGGVLDIGRVPADYLAAFLFFAGNIAIAFGGYPPGMVDHFWSLCVEEQFYLAQAPLARRLSRRGLGRFSVALLIAAAAARLVAALAGAGETLVWTLTVTRLDPIAAGILLATLRLPRINPWPGAAAGAATLLGGALICETFAILGTVLGYSMVAVGCALLVVSAMEWPAPPRPFLYLGRISYGLYVWHVLMTELVLREVRGGPAYLYLGGVALGLAATIAVSAASYQLYERRFLKLKRRFEFVPTAPVEAAAEGDVVPDREATRADLGRPA